MKNFKFQISNFKFQKSLFLVVWCLIALPLNLQAEPGIPEKLIYSIYWSGIKAGNALLEINNNPEGIIITSRVTSADFISIFYRVDDFVQSILRQDGYPKNYKMKLREGRHRRDKEVEFVESLESRTQKVIYRNKIDNEAIVFDSEKKVFDSLSGFYEVRKRELRVGHPQYIDIFDNKKFYNAEVQVLGKERISLPAGEFDTIVIKPILQSEGIFMRKGEIHIWLTDDEKKIPVMMKSKVKIGSFTAILTGGEY